MKKVYLTRESKIFGEFDVCDTCVFGLRYSASGFNGGKLCIRRPVIPQARFPSHTADNRHGRHENQRRPKAPETASGFIGFSVSLFVLGHILHVQFLSQMAEQLIDRDPRLLH